MFAVLSEINRLSLTPEVVVFDDRENEMVALGHAMTDVIFKTAEWENDREKRIMRQMELLKQGNCFMQENWVKRYRTQKEYDKTLIGKISEDTCNAVMKLEYEGPERRILYAPGVFMGDIRQPESAKQPFIFTHVLSSFADVKARFGGKDEGGVNDVWDRWKFVPTAKKDTLNVTSIQNLQNNAYTLSEVQEGFVEEIHYMDAVNNEYQILLNGIMMLPVGFPLSAISPMGKYNVTNNILQLINPFFAYGRSFVLRVKEQSDILDELLRLLILKTRKSIHPPYANTSGRVISPKVLMPGRITMGLEANALQAIGNEGQGVNSSEYQMYELIQKNIDENTVSRQFTGQQGKSGTTAFEVNVLREQSQKLLSLILTANIMMEMKLGYLRLYNILENYFEPIDTKYNDARERIESVYRVTSRKLPIDGQGIGTRQVIPTDELPSSMAVREEELFSGTPEKIPGLRRQTREDLGMEPLKKIYLSPGALRATKIFWYIDVDTRPAQTSSTEKLLFREELGDIALLTNMGATPNIEELSAQHAVVWNRSVNKLFKKQQPQQAGMPVGPGGDGRPPEPVPVPNAQGGAGAALSA